MGQLAQQGKVSNVMHTPVPKRKKTQGGRDSCPSKQVKRRTGQLSEKPVKRRKGQLSGKAGFKEEGTEVRQESHLQGGWGS